MTRNAKVLLASFSSSSKAALHVGWAYMKNKKMGKGAHFFQMGLRWQLMCVCHNDIYNQKLKVSMVCLNTKVHPAFSSLTAELHMGWA